MGISVPTNNNQQWQFRSPLREKFKAFVKSALTSEGFVVKTLFVWVQKIPDFKELNFFWSRYLVGLEGVDFSAQFPGESV